MSDARLTVRLTPRASRDALVGLRDGILAVRVSAPPVDGAANQALCRLIAAAVGVAPSRVSVVHGSRGREKIVAVAGMGDAELATALAAAI